ncbi:5'/3'-nucleotidase SurE [Nocardiopsis chromatogenes]|uniref:5'/3'-nucleotidase SurE n=1 Tax=Nocardiopsis chromatogenes TaxID=280239 RepID=UPI00036147FA|nr:5'/3'-nucleotidase SurE [Nocardiopsis chromatogenes]
MTNRRASRARPGLRWAATAVAAALALAGCSGGDTSGAAPETADFPAASLEGMRVLLANDDSVQAAEEDGADGLGLYALRSALCGAGADVVTFGPWGYQSSMSSAIHGEGSLAVGKPPEIPEQYAGDCADAPSEGVVYGVCMDDGPCEEGSPSATPVDSVSFALGHGLSELVGWDGDPDLMVSGVNSGPNLASQLLVSGTVGAALAAQRTGVPAVAVSAAIDLETGGVPPETYPVAADFAADLVARMHGAELLTADYVVNVNHPAAADGAPVGDVRWTEAGVGTVVGVEYAEDGGAYEMQLRACEPEAEDCRPEERENADAVATMAEGAVSVSPVTSDIAFGAEQESETVDELGDLVSSLGAD